MIQRIYLDNNATTALDDDVYKVLCEALLLYFGNPSSVHRSGQEAKAALVKARNRVAALLGVSSQEIVFTSTATEALNILLRGYLGSFHSGHVITSNLEHAAIFQTLTSLQTDRLKVSFLTGGQYGAVQPDDVERAIRPDTKLICLMAANNETGVLTDITDIAEIAQRHHIPFIVDGVALFGKQQFHIPPGVSAICFSGHKFHAPKGVGCMVVRKTLKFLPMITGGDQEGGRRAGTENVPAIIALAEAMGRTQESLREAVDQMTMLRDSFEEQLIKKLGKVSVNGQGPRVCNTSNLCFEGIDGEALLIYLDMQGIEASLGSACASGAIEPSRVLLNMGLSRSKAASSLRFSLSRYSTKEEIERAVQVIVDGVQRMRM